MIWRTGRKVGRTIYEQRGDEPSDEDELIGVMDTIELAEEAVVAINASRTLCARPEDAESDARTQT